jgi:hypothetical protein
MRLVIPGLARWRSWLIGLALIAVAVSDSAAQECQPAPAGLGVFFTGHSFHMFVPRNLDQVVTAAGIAGHKTVGTQGIGGSRVIQHWDLAEDRNKARPALTSGGVDVFTMAAHLELPDQGITNFVELGLAHNPRMRFLVQASWFPYDLPGEGRIRDNAQRDEAKIEELQAAVDAWRTRLEGQVDDLNRQHGKRAVFIVPAGDAVVQLRQLVVDGKYPGVSKQSELFRDPIGHGGPHLQWLVTYCNFAAIYGRTPEGLKLATDGVDAGQHAILQRIAWQAVAKYPRAGVAVVK